MPGTDHHSCIKCGKPATLLCNGCNDTHDGIQTEVYYCDTACQQTDWQSHKASCSAIQARKRLYRAGELLQATFYVLRGENFDLNLAKVQESNGKIDIFDAPADVFAPTSFLLNTMTKDQLAKAAYSYNAGGEAYYGAVHELCVKAFKGLAARTEEITVQMLQSKMRTRRFRTSSANPSTDNIHHIICVTLKNGDKYALDLAGAQHGQYDAVLAFAAYQKDYVAKIISVLPYGHSSRDPTPFLLKRHPGPVLGIVNISQRLSEVSDYVVDQLYDWEDDHQTVSALLKAKPDDFDEGKAKLVSHLAEAAREYIKLCNGDPTAKARPILATANMDSNMSDADKARVARKVARKVAKMDPESRRVAEKQIADGTNVVFM